ncbi:hypothetical protein L227DRAFT_567950 [Lentinus tigrinus ALCF2SS1-6]|uniref:Uncharacterized protein n=1 Tax=Lentinus tigrinus ALCF2SS1-6 TaxID=1328759 RepID=A0A5C2RPF3_9APHY|nr:hypothetical protein L227DRAFT_567950 [Lentinus tigrinus ALCF2SS1-6]
MDAPSSAGDTDWLMQSPHSAQFNTMDIDPEPIAPLIQHDPASAPLAGPLESGALPELLQSASGPQAARPEEAEMEVDIERERNAHSLDADIDLGGGIHGQLERIYATIARLHQAFLDHQRTTDARLIALDEHRCLRKHVKLTMGFSKTDALPNAPSDEEIRRMLHHLNRGEALQKPFRVNWRDPPTSTYNVCVENAFSADFWAGVNGGQYDIALIPERYREQEAFNKVYRRHIAHLRKCWTAQQNPTGETQKKEKARHYARNSRMSTVRILHAHIKARQN